MRVPTVQDPDRRGRRLSVLVGVVLALSLVSAGPLLLRQTKTFFHNVETSGQMLENSAIREMLVEELQGLSQTLEIYYGAHDWFSYDAVTDKGLPHAPDVELLVRTSMASWSAEAFHADLPKTDKCVMWNGLADDASLQTMLLPGKLVNRGAIVCTWDP